MTSQEMINSLNSSQEFFERSSRCLTEQDSGFRPSEGTWTASQQVAHVAQTIEWFIEGAARPEGFDLNFDQQIAELQSTTSLTQARERLAKSFDTARSFFSSKTAQDLDRPLPAGPVMGGEPIRVILGAIIEHTAHHRGALTVYSRLLGKTPLMPYME